MAPPSSRPPRLVRTVPEVAHLLGVSVGTARRRAATGELGAVQVGGTWRIPIEGSPGLGALPAWCTVGQVANSLDVSIVTVRRWIRDGDVPATRHGRHWRIPRAFLERLLASVDSGMRAGRPG